jgi:hypothetical protein
MHHQVVSETPAWLLFTMPPTTCQLLRVCCGTGASEATTVAPEANKMAVALLYFARVFRQLNKSNSESVVSASKVQLSQFSQKKMDPHPRDGVPEPATEREGTGDAHSAQTGQAVTQTGSADSPQIDFNDVFSLRLILLLVTRARGVKFKEDLM